MLNLSFRETSLLIDPKVATIDHIHRVTEIIAHKLAHQWFGNLVTMKWWTDLWLIEGFAAYVAARGVDFVSLKFFIAISNISTVILTIPSFSIATP